MSTNQNIRIDLTENSLLIWKPDTDYDIFDSWFIRKSPNKTYVFSQGTYCKNANDPGTDVILLLSANDILYRKKINFDDIPEALVFDDGSVVFYTDENQLISLDSSGKQIFKKNVGIDFNDRTCQLTREYAYFYGNDYNNDDDIMKISFISYATKKMWTKVIPDIPYSYFDEDEEEEDFYYAYNADFLCLPRGFLILYEDKKTTRMYDFDGNEITPTEEEFAEILEYINKEEYRQQALYAIKHIAHLAKKEKQSKKAKHFRFFTKKEQENKKQSDTRLNVDKNNSSNPKQQNTTSVAPESPQNHLSAGPKKQKNFPRWLIYIIIAFVVGMIKPNLFFPTILVECILNLFYIKGHVLDEKKRKRSKILTIIFLFVAIIGCIGSVGVSTTPSVETLTLSSDIQNMDVNESQTLTWTYTPEDADISQLSAVVSDDTLAQASFNENGELILKTSSQEGTVDVTLQDDDVISNVITFTIVDAEKAEAERIAAEKAEAERIAAKKAVAERMYAEQPDDIKQSNQQTDSRTVYVTPTGSKYHYNSNCNDGNYSATTLDKALSMGLTPCKKCVG